MASAHKKRHSVITEMRKVPGVVEVSRDGRHTGLGRGKVVQGQGQEGSGELEMGEEGPRGSGLGWDSEGKALARVRKWAWPVGTAESPRC